MRALRLLVLRPVSFAALWFVLVEGEWRGWGFGVVAVVGAVATSHWLLPVKGRSGIHPIGGLRLVWFFLVQSIVGGVDVGLRALDPRLPIRPGMVDVDLPESSQSVHTGLLFVVSVLPGTVAVGFHDGELRVHALDVRSSIDEKVGAAQWHIAAVLGDQNGEQPGADGD